MAPSTASESSAPTPRQPGCLRWAVLTLLAATLIGGILAWKFIEESARFVWTAGDWLHRLGDSLISRSVEESFRETVTRVISTEGDILELATIETFETFTRADSRSLFGDLIYLGTTISEIRVPVVYRYHLRLSDPWHMEIRDRQCRVLAPQPRPSLPPAIRTEGMEKKSESGWLRFNAAENLARLEKDLTPRLEQRAGDKRHLNLAREANRQSAAAFIRKWMLQHHPDTADLEIRVTFPDEPAPAAADKDTPP